MTIDQKVEAYRMRLDGHTLEEVADHFGVTKQRIQQIIPPVKNSCHRKRAYKACVYPAISRWLYENRYSYTSFAKLIGVSFASVRRWFSDGGKMEKSSIDKILEVTGLTYEEAFRRSEKTCEN